MSNLLKEAIADAKQIRATALANAQMALQEAFTPKLQSMLSKQIQSEVEGGEEDEFDVPVDDEVPMEPEVPAEVPVDVAPEVPAEVPVEDPMAGIEAPVEDPMAAPEEEIPIEEPEVQEADLNLGDDEDPMGGIGTEDEFDEFGEQSEFDIESILRELESESNVVDEIEEPTFEENTEFDPITGKIPNSVDGLQHEEITDNTASGSPKVNDKTDAITQGTNTQGGTKVSNSKDNTDASFSENTELDLEAILREIEDEEKEDEDEEKEKEEKDELKSENEELKNSLEEHIKVVKFLKSKLEEVNLLNAKLLYTSKLFKSNNMNNDQKMKVIENFDRAKSLREVKLVYATISESYSAKKVSPSVKKITEGASKATGQKPVKQVIKEEVKNTSYIIDAESKTRLQRLSGIIKDKK